MLRNRQNDHGIKREFLIGGCFQGNLIKNKNTAKSRGYYLPLMKPIIKKYREINYLLF